MVTDTALFRNPHYHTPADLPEALDYDTFTRVVDGLEYVVAELSRKGNGSGRATSAKSPLA
jgi:hypothetical protein